MILSEDVLLKSSFTVFAVNIFCRMIKFNASNGKCLTVKGSLQDIQKGGCSLVSKYARVNLMCPIVHLVILVWFCLL